MLGMKILIVEESAIFCKGLQLLLNREKDVEHTAWTCDGQEMDHLITEMHPDIILLNTAVPNLGEYEDINQIKSKYTDIRLIIICASCEHDLLEAFRAGADAFVSKNRDFDDLIQAIRSVYRSEAVFDSVSIQTIRSRLLRGNTGHLDDELSKREHEVLKHVAYGMHNKDIAKSLSVSQRTVNMHLDKIYQKLNVANRVEAVLKGLAKGWFTLGDVTHKPANK